jgi:hypothetical protein
VDSFNNGKQMVLLNDQVFRSQQGHNICSSPKPPIDSPTNFILTALRGDSSELNWPQLKADYSLFQVLILIIRYISPFSLYGIMLSTTYFYPYFYIYRQKTRIALLVESWIFSRGSLQYWCWLRSFNLTLAFISIVENDGFLLWPSTYVKR